MKPDVSDMSKVYRMGYIVFAFTHPMGGSGPAQGASGRQGLEPLGMLDACMPIGNSSKEGAWRRRTEDEKTIKRMGRVSS